MSHMAFVARCQRKRKKIAERRRAVVVAANERFGVDVTRDPFTVEPVEVLASSLVGTPRRVLYRVFYRGVPVGWSTEAKASEDLARLNQIAHNRKRGAA